MPFRPTPSFRRNIQEVIYPLTEAVRRVYGNRQVDGAYPLGAFYPINVSKTAWIHAGSIWFIPESEEKLDGRNPREEVVLSFISSIESGESVELPGGNLVTWERISESEAVALP